MNVRMDTVTCDRQGCDEPAVTERKIHFAVEELCSKHAAAFDATCVSNFSLHGRLAQIRIGVAAR